MADRHILYRLRAAIANAKVAVGSEIEIDDTNLSSVIATDSQAVATELERLYGVVAGLQQPTTPSTRPLNIFSSSVVIGSGNLGDFINRNSIFVGSSQSDFTLPPISVVTGQYPAIFEIQNFGTAPLRVRRNPEYDPTNLGTYLRRRTETGANLQFIELDIGETVIVTKQDSASPWIGVEGSTDPRSSILPDGVFQFNSRGASLIPNVNNDFVVFLGSGFTPSMGDAFEVTSGNIDETSSFGRRIRIGDVLVAKVDNPNRLLTVGNDDWLIIEDAGVGELTFTELRFLAQISESDSFSDSRLMDRADVTDARVWLSDGILDHAPFLTPSTDPNNPQTDGTTYLGGEENDGADFEFRDSTNRFNYQVYVDIDGSFSTDELANTFLLLTDRDGVEVERHNLLSSFRPIILTGSTDTYYVFDNFPLLTDNFSSIHYINGYTLDLVYRTTNRQFNLSSNVNVVGAIPDDSITIEKLEPNAQALLQSDHDLSDAEQAKLDGLQTSGTATPWTAGELLLKIGANLPSNDLASYQDVGQGNGIISNYDRTTDITFLVPNFVTVNGLQKVETPATKTSVSSIGTILGRQAFTATLPASSFNINDPIPDLWQVDGTASNLFLSGADDTFKITHNNLDQSIIDELNRPTVEPSQLPASLETLAHDLTVTSVTGTAWRSVTRPATSIVLTRQFAFGWDENRRLFGTDNYFEDLTGIQATGYGSNNIFYYADPLDPLNTAFSGAQSYILNDNVRIRNQAGQTKISDSSRKIVAFDYALQRSLTDTDNLQMLRVGGSSATPLMGLSQAEGLYLNVGRGDGGTRTRVEVDNMTIAGSGSISYPFSTFGGSLTSGEAEFVVPSPNTPDLVFPLTATIKVRLSNNGNDEGTFEQSYVITSFGTDQAPTTFVSSHSGFASKTWRVRAEFNHQHAVFGQQDLLFIDDSLSPENNQALAYYVSVEYSRTITYNVPATYAREPINAGNGHDDFGLYDPSRYNTEHIQERNRVILSFEPASLFDTSTDPEMAIRVIVDGQKEGSSDGGYLINLHRSMSEFEFDDMSFGNNTCAVSHIQCYDYDSGHTFGEDDLLRYYNAADSWLGFFRHPTETTDTFQFNGKIEVLPSSGGEIRGFILTAPDGNRHELTITNDGSVDTKTV